MTTITKEYNGKRYTLAITRVSKSIAEKEAKKLRKAGVMARLDREPDGKYNVYSRR